MPNERDDLPIVADASPLIVLARVDRLRLLDHLYGGVLVPSAVYRELELARRRPGYEALARAVAEGWLVTEPVIQTRDDRGRLGRVAGAGEREAILLALRRPCRFLLIDERAGRQLAERAGVPVVGTGGVLLAAKERGLISSVRTLLDEMATCGFRLSGELRQRLLQMAGEATAG